MKSVYVGALLGSLFSVVAIGIPVTNAYAIPGIDKPFDPANYYSLTTISYADSPSPFAIRELLGGQGNQTKIQQNNAAKILSCIPPLTTIQNNQYASDLSKILRDINSGISTESAIKKYIGNIILPEFKKNVDALGIGENEKKILIQNIDAAFNLSEDELATFAKKVVRRETENILKDYLNKELMKVPNCYGTIMIGGAINGNGDINIDTGDVLGVGTPVYDYLKEVQEILAQEKTQVILEKLGIKTSDLNKMLAKLPAGLEEQMEQRRRKLYETTKEINTTEDITDNAKIFGITPTERGLIEYDAEKLQEIAPLSSEEKYAALQKEYQRIVEVVRKNRDDVANQYDALNEIIELNNQVIGEEQAIELNTRAKAIQTEIQTRENIIMSQLVRLRAIKQRMKANDEEQARLALIAFSKSATVADPFDEEEQKEMERIGYKRHEVPDKMPDFE